jgi:hypothetical protein
MTTFPFEVPFAEVQTNIEAHVSAVFSCLESEFLVMPKGSGFIEYATFETGYEALKRATREFADVTPVALLAAATEVPISLLVLRTILGFTPPELAYLATQRTGVEIGQGFIRTLDRQIRLQPLRPLPIKGVAVSRIQALLETVSH